MTLARPPRADGAVRTPPIHDASDLTGADGTAWVVLRDQVYVLRITRAGKLILTK